ncbi:GNAT family N-acetyltransferase [Conyzicola sp.]|uniref:GNAT family N-acetyltransferase n=1 Tax=Conyzicola sp. TaxID=1969404 RepID=UPI0039895174
MDKPQIEHEPERTQYTLVLDGSEIGYARYTDTATQRVFTHTVVQPEFGGRGFATGLIEFAVAEARAEDKRIVGECPMVAHWLGKHPELADYVDEA